VVVVKHVNDMKIEMFKYLKKKTFLVVWNYGDILRDTISRRIKDDVLISDLESLYF